ncbi:putative reverse transcriptase domain-containing protein [Tanacetum coccineum]
MLIDHEYVNCPLRFDDRIRPANLLPIHMFDFDVILGMDWLASHRATIDCYARTVIFGNVHQPEFVYHGSSPLKSVKLISAMKARTLISHGCQGFLASVMDTSLESPNIENLSVVREFADVFPDELPGLPPAREIEFGIELIPGAEPISKAPYRMAPVELKELKEQLQEMLENGFIRPSVSPWGAPVLFVKKKDGSMRLCIDYRELNQRIYAKFLKCEFLVYNIPRPLVILVSAQTASLGSHQKVEAITKWAKTYLCDGVITYASRQLKPYEVNISNPYLELAAGGYFIEDLRHICMNGKHTEFSVDDDGVVWFEDRLCVPNDQALREKVMTEAHSSPFTIHPGSTKMYRDLKQYFWWNGMKQDVAIGVPVWKWERISMDYR